MRIMGKRRWKGEADVVKEAKQRGDGLNTGGVKEMRGGLMER